MKKSILLIMAAISTIAFGQNVTENKVTFNYIQLPTNPLSDDYTSFNVVVERKYEQANEDSLTSYATRLDQATIQYEAEKLAWMEQKRVVDRTHLQAMATWQKGVNAGTVPVPVKPKAPVYPVQPIMANVMEPHLHSDVVDDQISNAVSLAGYDRGNDGVTITVGIMPLSDVKITMTTKGEGAAKKYNYAATYKLPIEVKVEDPTQGVVLQTIIMNSMRSYSLNSYSSQYEFDLWWLDNQTKFWTDIERTARNGSVGEVSTFVNNKCGFPVKSRTAQVYSIKKFKDHQYSDLTNAYTVAGQGYQMVGQSRDRSKGASKINEAIKIWKQVLTESDVNNKKARINDKVTAMIYCNLAEAYIWLSEFDTAEQYINQAINSGVNKFKRAAQALKGMMTERKMRWNTNF